MKSDELRSATGKEPSFIDTNELLQRLPISRRTLANWRTSGKIPYVCLAGGRVLFHWPSVEEALLRRQHGGTEA